MFEHRSSAFDVGSFDTISLTDAFERGDNRGERERYRRFVGGAVRYLPPKQREVVLLYFVREMKMYEIAAQLGVDISTVSRRLTAAKSTMRRLASMCRDAGLFSS